MNYARKLRIGAILIGTMSLIHAAKTVDSQLNGRLWAAIDAQDDLAVAELFTGQTVPDVNAPRHGSIDQNNMTPLIYAAKYGLPLDIVQALVSAGADIDAQDCWGNSALIEAILNTKSTDIALFLINKGAEPNLQNCAGNTAFHYAVLHDRQLFFQPLLEIEADTTIENNNHKTAFDMTAPKNRAAVRRSIVLNDMERAEKLAKEQKTKSASEFDFHALAPAPQKKKKVKKPAACCVIQ